MKRAERDEWVAALRSGNYEQGITQLNSHGRQCCLGVKCMLDVAAGRHGVVDRHIGATHRYATEEEFSRISGELGNSAMPSHDILVSWGLSYPQLDELTFMNDALEEDAGGHIYNFNAIADWIEENIEVED